PGIEIARVIDEAIRARWRLPGVAHADQVGCQTAMIPGHVRNDVAPEIRGRRVAVEEHDGIAAARVDVRHLRIEDPGASARMRIGGGDSCVDHGRLNGNRARGSTASFARSPGRSPQKLTATCRPSTTAFLIRLLPLGLMTYCTSGVIKMPWDNVTW